MSDRDDYGLAARPTLTDTAGDTARARRKARRAHREAQAMLPELRPQSRSESGSAPADPTPLAPDELDQLHRLLTRLRPTDDSPFPERWLEDVTRVVRLVEYLNH